jgi:hypothetical protein
MEKTYRKLIDNVADQFKKEDGEVYVNMQIPHPNGKVYLIIERVKANSSIWGCFEASKEKGNWVMKPVSKDFSNRMDVENPLFDLSVLFQDLLPEEDNEDSNICPKCGQDFMNHNEDGSCVID